MMTWHPTDDVKEASTMIPAEDLVQETFYRVLKAFRAGTGWLPSALKDYRPWLFRITTNLAIDLLRRWTRLTWCALEATAAVPTSGTEGDPEEVYARLEGVETVCATLKRLPERSRRMTTHTTYTRTTIERGTIYTRGGAPMTQNADQRPRSWSTDTSTPADRTQLIPSAQEERKVTYGK
jgi:hypothetical protein